MPVSFLVPDVQTNWVSRLLF